MHGTNQQILAVLAGMAMSLGLSAGANAAIFNADINNADLLGLINAVHLEVMDEVDDGCWTNIADIQSQVQGLMGAAGIPVAPITTADSATHPALIVSARGQRVEGSYCIVQTEVRMSFITASRFAAANGNGDVTIVNYNSVSNMFRANVAVVSSEHVNAEIQTWVGQVITALATEIANKRQDPDIQAMRTQLGMSN